MERGELGNENLEVKGESKYERKRGRNSFLNLLRTGLADENNIFHPVLVLYAGDITPEPVPATVKVSEESKKTQMQVRLSDF